MKKRKLTKVLKYTAVFEPAKEGGYVVTVPALPGCVTQGDTYEEAIRMAKDAIEGYLAVLSEEGEKIPTEPKSVIVSKIEVTSPASI
jgi:antitoxin HicB